MYLLTESNLLEFVMEVARRVLDEARGALLNTDDMCRKVDEYVTAFIRSKEFEKSRSKTEGDSRFAMYDEYEFTIPSKEFKNVNTLFMADPEFTIRVKRLRHAYDYDDSLWVVNGGDYEAHSEHPVYVNGENGTVFLKNPRFMIHVITLPNLTYDRSKLYGNINHELIHAAKNYYEFVNGKNSKSSKSYQHMNDIINVTSNENDSDFNLFYNIKYAISKNEIGARINQAYHELNNLPDVKAPLTVENVLSQISIVEHTNTLFGKLIEMLEFRRNRKDEFEKKLQSKYVNKYKHISFDTLMQQLTDAFNKQSAGFERVVKLWIDEHNRK